ncbi:unnamed protein product [Adineta steineri]|uniref:MAM domain-containing protein n=1 Tax=Adineta steineri TaxID=433720 RepID=A0A815W6Y6_9BILA|nr:unnamed protein product [Adineta steineri]CAF1656945.1 unnamed protein product [Adineta steineri]
MRQFLCFIYFVFINIAYVYTQILYECNFDDGNILHHCFTMSISVVSSVGKADILPPDAPLSDVTSSLKPNDKGEVCQLPYQVKDYDWDMYFCNDDHCPTASNPNSWCNIGRFGHVQLFDTAEHVFPLSTPTGGINGTDEQCLIFYYYMSTIGTKNITIFKQEKHTHEEIIDSITSSPFNGWIRYNVSFISRTSDYEIFFVVQKMSTSGAPHIGFDEISIHQGSCDDQTETTTQSIITSSEMTTLDEITSKQTEDPTTRTTTTILSSTYITPIDTSSSTATSKEEIHTSTIVENIIISSYAQILPYETHHIIILSTVIPLVWIVFIVVVICIKRSNYIRNERSNSNRNMRLSNQIELHDVSPA